MIGINGIAGESKDNIGYIEKIRDLFTVPGVSIKDYSYCNSNFAASLILRKELSEERLNTVFWENETYVIFLDGYINLTKEVDNVAKYILENYLKDKSSFINGLNGEYNVLIYKKDSKDLILFNDRFAARNLFICKMQNTLFFSSEIKSILLALPSKPGISETGLVEFFSFAHNIGSNTIYKNIEAFLPATMLTFKNGTITTECYWELKFSRAQKSSAEFSFEMASTLKNAAKEKYEGRNKLGLGLSGGLDSRVIAATIPKTLRPIFARTYGEKNSLEVKIASKIAERLNFNHFIHTAATTLPSEFLYPSVWRTECTIPFLGLKSITEHKNLKDRMLYNLGGQFGDVLVGKQLRPFMFLNSNRKDFIEKVFNNYISNTFRSTNDLKRIFNEDFYKRNFSSSKENFVNSFDNINSDSFPDLYDSWDLTHRQPRFTFSSGRVDNYLFQKIKLFTDYNFIDIALQVKPSLRFGQILYKKMIASQFPELIDIPNSNTGELIRSSRLLNYVDLIRQYRSTMKRKENMASSAGRNSITQSDEGLKRIIFRFIEDSAFPAEIFSVMGITDIIEEHCSQKKNHSYLISALATFIAAFNMFFINNNPTIPDQALPFN